jgi:hypothetical protein
MTAVIRVSKPGLGCVIEGRILTLKAGDDIGSQSCCVDTTYCLYNANWTAQCCQIGSNCGSLCDETSYLCNTTIVVTTATPTSTEVRSACCPRKCTSTSQYGCPASLGGGCCGYGEACASSSQCLATAQPSTTPLVTELAPGCTTSQVGCPGGGCCDAGFTCTTVSNTGYCASATITPTASGISETSQPGLSQGAKAGIGAGVAIGACLIIGALTFLCVRRRRIEQSRRASSVGDRSARPAGTFSPGASAGVPPMSENASDAASPPAGRRRGLRGLTQDYFGPVAVQGPFTEAARETARESTPNLEHGVPVDPQHPGHIQAPVEMDSPSKPGAVEAGSRTVSYTRSPLGQDHVSDGAPSPEQSDVQSPQFFTPAQGRFELYGSDLPSPSTHEETRHEAEG